MGPIYPLKDCEIEKSNYFHRKNLSIGLHEYPKIKALSAVNFELKMQLLFVVFGVFLGKMGPKVKDQEVRGQVSTTFSEAHQCDLSYGKRILVVAYGNLTLFQL